MAKLTISIVNFNSGDYLLETLDSINKTMIDLSCEVWIIDNNSSDSSIQKAKKRFPQFNYIENKENLGFGKANNLVLSNLKSEYALILNPDVKLGKNDLKEMISFMDENEDVGACSPEIVLPNGEIDLTAHRGFPTPWASFKYFFLKDDSLYHLTTRDFSKPHQVDAITGAFFLTRKSVLDRVGLFDEDYFMYAEDIDLCFRIKKAGFKIMYVPSVRVLHHKGISTGLKKHSRELSSATFETKRKMVGYFYSTMKLFYLKNLSRSYPFFINWLVYLGINLKMFLAKKSLTV